MKKQKSDAGLSYLKITGIRAAKDKAAIQKEFEGVFGKKEGGDFLKGFYELADKGKAESYEVKNEDYDKCMLLTGSFDADTIRRAGNWIVKNKEYFGKKILDVGCDCGLMSCFLGVNFPESEITAIDRGVNGVKVGEKLAKKLGLKNIKFISADLRDFGEGDFDTVFSMRTIMENGSCKEDRTDEFLNQAKAFGEAFGEYGKLLASKAAPEGTIVSIENTERDPLFLGWITALYDAGFTGVKEGYQEFLSKEVSKDLPCQTLVMKRGSEGSALDFYIDICDDNGDFVIGDSRGWNAKMIYETQKDQLIEGYVVSGVGAEIGSVFSLWTRAGNENEIIFYQSHEGEAFVQLVDVKDRQKMLNTIHEVTDSAKDYPGLQVTRLS